MTPLQSEIPKGACAFCGVRFRNEPQERRESDEHVIARQLLKYIPQWTGGRVLHQRLFPDEPMQEWTKPELDVVARRVCKRCNSGWMDRMDHDAIPFLAPMMRSQPIRFTEHGQSRVAAWASKVALGLLLSMPKAIVGAEAPIEHYRKMYVTRMPPRWSSIWLAAYEDWPRIGFQEPFIRRKAGVHVYGATILLGNMVAQAVGSSIGQAEVTGEAAAWDEFIIPIWPFLGYGHWPPRMVLKERNLSAFCKRFLPI